MNNKILGIIAFVIILSMSGGTYLATTSSNNSPDTTPTATPTDTPTYTATPTAQPTTPTSTTEQPITNPTTNPTNTGPAETTMTSYWLGYSNYNPPTIKGQLYSGVDPITRISIGVPNKTINLYYQAEDGTWSSLNQTTTNSNGEFTFTFDQTTLLMEKTLKASFDGDANYQATSAIVGQPWW
jgi:hypothetical protein